jgi:hypothetical protein
LCALCESLAHSNASGSTLKIHLFLPIMRALLVLLLLGTLGILHLFGMRAPDVAPDLPDGWCNRKYGNPTRTTGECICKPNAVCTGPGCINEQGFIFYSGVTCPSCECVEGKREPRKRGEKLSSPGPIPTLDRQKQHEQQGDPNDQDDSTIMDFIVDDLPRALFAVVVLIGVIAAIGVMLKSAPASASVSTDKPKSSKDRANKED